MLSFIAMRLSHGLQSQPGSWHARRFVWFVPRQQILVYYFIPVGLIPFIFSIIFVVKLGKSIFSVNISI